MQFSAAQIATMLHGRIEGNPDVLAGTVARIEDAGAGTLSFIAHSRYLEHLAATKAAVIIISEDLYHPTDTAATLIVVKDAYLGFTILLEQYNELMNRQNRTGTEQPSYVADGVKAGADIYIGAFSYISTGVVLGNHVKIYPGCYIGRGVVIGDGSCLFPGVRVYDGCVIGARVIIHSGVVVGADGFGFAPQEDGAYRKIPQLGNVVIEDDVEIGSNTTIDRATMGSTVICRGVKLDNLIQIAHNAEIGEHTVIAAQTGVSGSTRLGKRCMIGGQVGIVGHIQVADSTRINAQSGLAKSVTEPGTALTGTPAGGYRASLKSQAIIRNLPAVEARLRDVEHKLEAMTQLLQQQSETK